ncbi:MAG: AMP-binding protein [Proteobacteria bacterium]|nr:AMP-binding protein [Pseudomonadota bacterium]
MTMLPEPESADWSAAIKRVPASKPLLVAERGTLLYGEFADHVARLGGAFEARGWKRGSRLMIASRDDRIVLAVVVAALVHGLVPVMADPDAPEPAATILREVSRPDAFVIDAMIAAAWGLVPDGTLWIIPAEQPRTGGVYRKLLRKSAEEGGFFSSLRGAAPGTPPSVPSAQEPALIIFTSGSTARPKAVELSHGAVGTHLQTLMKQFGLDDGSRLCNLLPFHHADGIIQGGLLALASGATLYRPLRFQLNNVQKVLDTLYAERITHFTVVPAMLAIILRLADGLRDAFADLELKAIISTAGHLEARVWDGFEQRYGYALANVYGLTETVCGAIFSGPPPRPARKHTLGKPSDCRIKIMADETREASPGETGEIWLAGPNLMSGYFADEAASAEVLRDGWLRTGDLAAIDADGFVQFSGRKKNVLVSGGHTIQPEEITAALKRHPDVVDAATLGLPHPELEEIPVSAVMLNPGSAANEVTLTEHCRAHLAPYKVPRRIALLSGLPYGPSGKVQLEVLRERIQNSAHGMKGEGDVSAQVFQIARDTFRARSPLSVHSSPENTFGWDSMGHLTFVFALEERFGIQISARDIIRLSDLGTAVEIVNSLRGHV